jgi:FK506-binding nuclear protein
VKHLQRRARLRRARRRRHRVEFDERARDVARVFVDPRVATTRAGVARWRLDARRFQIPRARENDRSIDRGLKRRAVEPRARVDARENDRSIARSIGRAVGRRRRRRRRARAPTRDRDARPTLDMFWGARLEPGVWTPYVPPPDVDVRLHVSQATAASDALEDGARVVIKMRCETDDAVLRAAAGADDDDDDDDSSTDDSFEREEYRVCALIGGRVETCGLDLVLDEYAEFTVEGACGAHLTGYYMPEYGEGDELDEDDVYGDEGDSDSDEEEEMMTTGDDDESDSEDDDSEDDDSEDDDSEDDDSEDDDSEDDDSEDDDSESESESESEPEGVTRKGGVKIVEMTEDESARSAKKREAETKPAKTPEPKKRAVEAKPESASKKPETPKRVHKNGMEIINTFATKNTSAKVAAGGKKVAMKYIGKLPSGKIFDQTKGSATFTFRLGVGEVIKGWDVGVEGMREGDKRTLIIPSAMGYGKKGIKGVIPGGSALHFDVELVKVF